MKELPVALYDCFSAKRFGGGQAAIVSDAAGLGTDDMQRIARDFALPATCFIQGCAGSDVKVRFFSTVGEYLMCGHAAIGLFTRLAETGEITMPADESVTFGLTTPGSDVMVRVSLEQDRPRVMLTLAPPAFAPAAIRVEDLCSCLGLAPGGLHASLPMERSIADFRHLIVPIVDVATLAILDPDFDAVKRFCLDNGLDSIAALTLDGDDADYRCREFCPAVGVNESPAAGTTNSALGIYLHRHDALGGRTAVVAHQGIELERPSEIHVELTVTAGAVETVSVGGFATRSLEGRLALPGH